LGARENISRSFFRITDSLTAILESDAEYLHEIAEDALDELEFNSGSHTLGMLDFEEDDEEWVLDADDEEEDEDEAEDEDWAH